MADIKESLEVPYKTPMLEGGFLNHLWSWFFRAVQERLRPLGIESFFDLANGQASAADIDGLNFDSGTVSQATIDYLVQRVTTSTGATEEIESGILIATYNPTSEDWNLHAVDENNPDDAGITFSITSEGQVQYTTDTITGTASISRIVWRARTLSAKHSTYSRQSNR